MGGTNQSFQCKDSYQNILADQGCKEDVESCQVGTICLPTSCASLLREYYKKIENRNKVECSNESIREEMDNTNPFSNREFLPSNHLGMTVWITKLEMEDEPTPLESLHLCFNSF